MFLAILLFINFQLNRASEFRGGSAYDAPRLTRSVSRYVEPQDHTHDDVGFRICISGL